MKFGFNLLLWTPHVTKEHLPVLRALKKAGYDGVEIPIFEGSPEHYAWLGGELDKLELGRTTVSVLGPGQNCISADKAQQKAALDRAKWVLDCNAALGSSILAGPMHSEIGNFSGKPVTKQELARAVSFHKKAGDYAARKNIRFAVEALNRFESYIFNTMQQLSDYLDEVDHPAVKAMYDTFHSNIEEKDPVAAIKTIKKHMIHVHISENDRGTPGRGHVPWPETYKALKSARYDGWLTIEAFGRALPELAAATRVWRDFFPNKEQVYLEGIKNMKKGVAKAPST
jgi:D-psicose/D-tagatose/L-ribulose 3-epimerase